MKWWAYLHTNGSLHVKRFFSFEDIDEAVESEFVSLVTPAFDADSREQAIIIAQEKLGGG